MQQWEYSTIAFSSGTSAYDAEKAMNDLGELGWELITITDKTDTAIFKRPKQATSHIIAGVEQFTTSLPNTLSRDEIVQHFVGLAAAIPKGTYYGVGARVEDLSTKTKVEISLHRTLVDNIQAAFKMFDDGFFTWSYRVSDWQVDYFKSS